MTNYRFPNLTYAFTVPSRFSNEDQAHVAVAFDNIIAHFAENAVNAQSVLLDDEPISLQEINDIELLAHERNEPELVKFVDWMTMYLPEIPSDALIAALYTHNEFLPPDESDVPDDTPEFIENEHGTEAQKYYDALVDLQCGNARKTYVTEDEFRMAAKISIIIEIYSDMDVAGQEDFPTFLRHIDMQCLNIRYEHIMSLKNVAGELDDPLDKFFTDYVEELENAMDDKAQIAFDAASPQKPNAWGLT